MSNIAIKVENLGKKFVIGHKLEPDLRNAFRQKLSELIRGRQTIKEVFWALKDIGFTVEQGEAVGIIGRNGAGKSTLLKILSRITEPSVGRFEIYGRVSSLLEVGTGFHMELTGRENIYLNGTILGMKRKEIKNKFDEIVSFSGVGKFLDTPVKHYSSGMKVRLAFAVAAHLEPEILIVDEVLAVGDAEFQKKCLGKMNEVSKNEGRTVLFVSHNLGAVQNLCTKGIVLSKGNILVEESISKAVQSYLNYQMDQITTLESLQQDKSCKVVFENMLVLSKSKELKIENNRVEIQFGREFEIRFDVKLQHNSSMKLYFAITFFDLNGVKVTTLDNLYIHKPIYIKSKTTISCRVIDFLLNPGEYYINLWCSDGYDTLQELENILNLEIVPSDYLENGKTHSMYTHGYLYLQQDWYQL